jgi:hypothetical protein
MDVGDIAEASRWNFQGEDDLVGWDDKTHWCGFSFSPI